jgi:hypothetical protein
MEVEAIMGLWGSGDPTTNGKKIDPRIQAGWGGGIVDPTIQSGWFDKLGDIATKAGDVAEKAGDVAKDATKKLLIRKYTLHGTLWQDEEGGDGWEMLPTGYVAAAAAAAIGLYVFTRK